MKKPRPTGGTGGGGYFEESPATTPKDRPRDMAGLIEDVCLEAWLRRPRPGVNVEDREAFAPALVTLGTSLDLPIDTAYDALAAKAAGWALTAIRPEIVGVGPSVGQLVLDVALDGPPEESPTLLRNGAILVRSKSPEPLLVVDDKGPAPGDDASARHPGGRLDVRAVMLYHAMGAWYATVFCADLQIWGYRFDLDWTALTMEQAVIEAKYDGPGYFGGGLKTAEHLPDKLLPGERDRAIVLPAIRWVLALGALLDAQGAPIAVEDGGATERLLRPIRYRAAQGVAWRTVHVSKKGRHPTVRIVDLDDSTLVEAIRAGDPTKFEIREVTVRPFLRRQPYGPKGALRRWVYVASFIRKQLVRREDVVTKTSVVAVTPPTPT